MAQLELSVLCPDLSLLFVSICHMKLSWGIMIWGSTRSPGPLHAGPSRTHPTPTQDGGSEVLEAEQSTCMLQASQVPSLSLLHSGLLVGSLGEPG